MLRYDTRNIPFAHFSPLPPLVYPFILGEGALLLHVLRVYMGRRCGMMKVCDVKNE
jgi:hypothetical protein